MTHYGEEARNFRNNIYTFYCKTMYFGSFDGGVRGEAHKSEAE